MENNILPHDTDAEQSLISSVLIDNSVFREIETILNPDDFYHPAHAKIYEAIATLWNQEIPADLVTLNSQLANEKSLAHFGGASIYLARIIDTAPLAIHAPHYARIVAAKARIRRLIHASKGIIRKAMTDGTDVSELCAYAESEMFRITQTSGRKEPVQIGTLFPRIIENMEKNQNKPITGVTSGFYELDQLTSGFQSGDLIILAARPSMGKSAIAMNMACSIAQMGKPVAVFSLEMTEEQLAIRLMASEARISLSKLRSGFLSRNDWTQILNAVARIEEIPLIVDDDADISVSQLRSKARQQKAKRDISLVIVDYLQLMKTRSLERRDLEIAELSRQLKAMAKELDIPVIALSQLNRKLEERGDKRPLLSDLRESGALEQDADVVLFVYRHEVYAKDDPQHKGKAELIISKQRNGPVGTVPLTFIHEYTKFENPDFYRV